MADTAINPGPAQIVVQGLAPLIVQSYRTSGVDPLLVSTLRRLFPNQNVPFVDAQGRVMNEWYRYLSAALESATTGVNALNPDEVVQAINDSRSGIVQLQALTVALDHMAIQNAASQAATVATVKDIAAQAAPTLVTQAAAIPPVQTSTDSAGGD